ncbi:Conserved_hypothetical protein [Hexamita inflata]|uniref:Uncharacterized protein n=1 Tax=Hexamita inflata TaxID=28002 RepID=A0AA86QXZ5_9EUKA|nr:Conserved hypothetical protein [Hexamita inflata]CAI9959532.1 Conserved hypothetical protein [Hexamita inflata]
MLGLLSFQFITVDPKTQRYMTEDGRQIVFHGMNAVTKLPPYLPNISGPFDSEFSLNEQDAIFLKMHGINMIRLGIMWPGVMPQQDQVNFTYLNEAKKIIDMLGKYGIYTLVDMHQDVLSSYFCGEGVPDWAVPYERKGVPNFAKPIIPEMERDPVTHKIAWETCLKTNFGVYYETALVGNMFECLYNQSCNPFAPFKQDGKPEKDLILQVEMQKFWAAVAKFFKGNQFVIGYDIINEPIAGDLWEHPSNYVNTGKFEKEVLQPFYQNMMKAIYAEDKNHIIFFEPVVSSITKAGFDVGGPGAAIGIPPELQTYAWHLYCMTMDKNGDPIQPKILCEAQDAFWYSQRNNSGVHLGLSQFIDEFGALPDDEISRENLEQQVSMFSKDAKSWAYWQYKPFGDITTVFNSQSERNEGMFNKDGTLQTLKDKILTHPYASNIAGKIQGSAFNFTTETLTLKFTTGKIGTFTEIHIGQLWKGFGFESVFIQGKNAVQITIDANQNYQMVKITNLAENQSVEVMIW